MKKKISPPELKLPMIVDRLYIGCRKSVMMSEDNYDLIVNCGDDNLLSNKCKNVIKVKLQNIIYYNKKIIEEIEMTGVLDTIHTYLNDKEKYVLVCCNESILWSCLIVAFYLIRYYKMNPIDALKYIRKRHINAFNCDIIFIGVVTYFYESFIQESSYKTPEQ